MKENPNRTAKAIKIVFAVFTLLYITVLCLVYFVEWNGIYVFSDRPEVILARKQKANALKQIVKSNQKFKSAFSKINKVNWLKYNPKTYKNLETFANELVGHTSAEELLAFDIELRMNTVLISHSNGSIHRKILAEKKELARQKLARELKVKLAQTKLKNQQKSRALKNQRLLKKRDHFLAAVSNEVQHKSVWFKVAKKEYVTMSQLAAQVKGLNGQALASKEMDIDANFITLNYYKSVVKAHLKRERETLAKSKTVKTGGVPILLDLDIKLKSNETPRRIIQSEAKKFLQKIDHEYKHLSDLKLYNSAAFLISYGRISSYFVEALRSNLSALEVTQILAIKKDVEQKRNKAEKVARSMIHFKPVKVDEKKLDAKYLAKVLNSGFPVEVENKLGIHFRFIPAGTFLMGSPKNESGRDGDELQHKVRISKPFYMQVSELSMKQFRFQRESDKNSRALVKVSKKMATEFIVKLNLREVLLQGKYALPTEAQWEYACRATTDGPHYVKDLKEIAFYDYGYSGKIGKRGQLKPNKWGLYDMLGNAKEICRDDASSSFFFTKPPKTYQESGTIVDPMGSAGNEMVLRGGGWTSSESGVRAAEREVVDAEYKLWDTGFRIIYELN